MYDENVLDRKGLALGLGSYIIWGLVPLYFKLLVSVPPWEVVAYRVLFTLVLLLLVTALRRRLTAVVTILRTPRLVLLLMTSSTLIGGNWLLYIWAISTNHLLASSLGYFLNPLLNVVLGVMVLRERLSGAQKVAIAIAAIGVSIAASTALSELWISVSLALSFALYGLVRKTTPVEAVDGLLVETLLLAPWCGFALVWWAAHGGLRFGQDHTIDGLMMGSAIVTSIPLITFATAARLLPYATLGLLQYIAPSLVFIIATLRFHEPLNPVTLLAFGLIWVALGVFSLDLLRNLANARVQTV